MKIKKIGERFISHIVNSVISSVAQTDTEKETSDLLPAEGMSELCRRACAEGAVLLKNDNNVLPVTSDRKVSVFGRVQNDTFFVGYGSGGDVNAPYKISVMQGLRNSELNINENLASVYEAWGKKNPVDNGFWGHWPMCYDEMPLDSKTVATAAAESDTALIIIGRAAGEDRENKLAKGSYYLTDEERNMLQLVSNAFKKTAVLLNIGGIMDFSWCSEFDISSLLIFWQGGMETGNALGDIISGKVSPSGKLTDTIAKTYGKYPSSDNFGNRKENRYLEDIYVGYRYFETFAPGNVLFCFGKGLTYSEFNITNISFSHNNGEVSVEATVKNTGSFPSKETLQFYYNVPCGKLGNPKLRLGGFAKTQLLNPQEEETLILSLSYYDISSFDDSGITGYNNSYVLENGKYTFFVGFDSRNTVAAGDFEIDNTVSVQQLTEQSAPSCFETPSRIKAEIKNGKYIKASEPIPMAKTELKQKILQSLPDAVAYYGDKGYKLSDVKAGNITMDDFVAQLTNEELEALSRGDYIMSSPLGAKGNAGVFAGVLESLRDKGVPAVTCTDGPSGIRLSAVSSLLPCGTLLACTYNPELVSDIYEKVGMEMLERGSDVLLAPGMNIHRDPLCGRNFEYFSEDPVVAGKIAAAVVTGLQRTGVSACPKHFACNNQETNRTHSNSFVSQRALREIYLKGFEICVKQAKPQNLMTSYNKINGVWGHYNFSLCTEILRKEWGYKGNVMTDWWMRSSASPEFSEIKDQAYRVRAQVDVLMPGGARSGKHKPDGTLLETYGKKDGITLGELQRTAKNVLNFAMNSSANNRV